MFSKKDVAAQNKSPGEAVYSFRSKKFLFMEGLKNMLALRPIIDETLKELTVLENDKELNAKFGADVNRLAGLGKAGERQGCIAIQCLKDMKNGKFIDIGLEIEFLDAVNKGNTGTFANSMMKRLSRDDVISPEIKKGLIKLIERGMKKDDTALRMVLEVATSCFEVFHGKRTPDPNETARASIKRFNEVLDEW